MISSASSLIAPGMPQLRPRWWRAQIANPMPPAAQATPITSSALLTVDDSFTDGPLTPPRTPIRIATSARIRSPVLAPRPPTVAFVSRDEINQ